MNGLGLMALVAVLYGTVERLRLSRTARSLLQGLGFGLGAVAAMASPALIAPGVLVDSRATFIATAGAFVGPVAALVAYVVAGGFRISIGGAGLVPGLVTLSIALVVGLAWRYLWFKRRPVSTLGLAVLGLGISLQSGLILILPVEMSTAFALTIAAGMTASALSATLILCSMMLRENRLIAREKALIHDAYTDPLTTLPNRRALLKAEPRLLELSGDRGYCLLLFDVDHFKSINDRFGHDVGDAALCILANVLREGLRAGDMVTRFGGEEFIVVLPEMGPAEGIHAAERLLSAIRERRIVLPEADFTMTASVGFVHAHGGVALAGATARADEALYAAKAAGRDRVCAADPLSVKVERPESRAQAAPGSGARSGSAPAGLPVAQRAP